MSRKTKKVLTNQEKFDIMFFVKAVLCNGSTTDSDSVCWGSNPYSAAKYENPLQILIYQGFAGDFHLFFSISLALLHHKPVNHEVYLFLQTKIAIRNA